jgi:MFS family permease
VRLLADTTPLKVSADFRRLWIGQAISFAGSMITTTALPYQVFHDTHSSLAVGLLGLAQLGPLLACALVGGAIADGFDKKKVLLLAIVVSFACSVALAANATLEHPHVWLLFVIAPLSSASFAMGYPVLRSLLPLLLEPALRPAGYALQSVYGSFGMMAGPALAGALIAAFGLQTAYTIDAVTYVVAALIYLGLAAAPPLAKVRASTRNSVIEGLRFLRGHRVILSTFGIDTLAMVFGMPRALFPALADRLGGGPVLYGLLMSSVAAGAFLASLGSGWTSRIRRQGRAVLVCVSVWGLAI